MTIKDYRELRVYQSAFKAAVEIFNLTKKFPPEEKYSLTDQIRRSSRSVCANIAESWRKRRYANHFVGKLSDADAEAAETIVWLDFALQFGYLGNEEHQKLVQTYDHVCGQLTIMMAKPQDWILKPEASK